MPTDSSHEVTVIVSTQCEGVASPAMCEEGTVACNVHPRLYAEAAASQRDIGLGVGGTVAAFHLQAHVMVDLSLVQLTDDFEAGQLVDGTRADILIEVDRNLLACGEDAVAGVGQS